MVLTRDEHHPDTPVVARPVVATLGNTAQILRLIVGEREIRTSPEHPFYVKDRGWRPARLIQPGDELLTEAGTWARCAAAVLTADFAPVYNVEIAEHHTYFVGAAADGSAVWAHNACSRTSGKNRFAQAGKAAHRSYNPGKGYELNTQIPGSNLRPDAWDPARKIVRELKPNTSQAIARGERQLEGYVKALQAKFGGTWRAIVDTYEVTAQGIRLVPK